jgi:cytochrome oxidase Cu insertion factor (SCO1/SenC/PrrC family)
VDGRWISGTGRSISAGERFLAAALIGAAFWSTLCTAGVLDVGGVWVDDSGSAVSLSRWQGRYTVLTMSTGACRKICSTTLRRMEELQAIADQRHLRLEFLVIGLDPRSDTPKAWREYRAQRKLGRENWHFVGGDDGRTRRIAEMLGISYWFYDEHLLHDFKIVLIAPDGTIKRALAWSDDRPDTLFSGLSDAPSIR